MKEGLFPYIFDVEEFITGSVLGGSAVKRLSAMQAYFSDKDAVQKILADGDPILYEYWEKENTASSRDISFGLTKVFPGKVGPEFYMTRGHYHGDDSVEVYYTLSGHGRLLLMNREGQVMDYEMQKGVVNYIPKDWAHRTVNIGNEPLIFIWFYPSVTVHDYETIEKYGFATVVSTENGFKVKSDVSRG